MENLEGSLQKLQLATGSAMVDLEKEAAALLNPLQGVGDLRGAPTLAGLFRMLFQRGLASRTLVASQMDWDAEIVLRAFYETMAKILRICVAPDEDKAKLLDEYWNNSAETHNRRKKVRAAWVEKQSRPFDEVATAIFSLVQDDRVTPITSDSTKAERKLIEQKWSFSGIVEYLSAHAHEKFDLGNAKLLLHSYGMASHFVHADHNALDLLDDRRFRTPEDRIHVEAAHAARILTDQVSLAFLCLAALELHLGTRAINKAAVALKVDECLRISRPIMSAFYDNQRGFYEKMGYKFSDSA